ncbi:DUF983 domain-containing protein [Sphingorhabdus sp. SMR4y]|uniref:DUF983 domain-containing protein n=1 Tax=Sphingorhabdus sp. SMR4y TaxID=2584094 RepID=UPI000B5CEB89|nr:DUF983 domain-containing protein [Sphingorhabdus sp. SMR4y]ASK89783.1 membrane protein [Sphingorhabdus sp. SMR4y]
MTDTENEKGQPDVLPAALFGLCPRCGQKTLFANLTRFSDNCRACGLDYSVYNVGDGPAAFLTLIVGAVILGLALAIEANFHPSIWVHIMLWVPLTVAAVVGSLRVSKALLLILEHRNQAREGSIDGGEAP